MVRVSNFRFHMEGKTAKWVESYQDIQDPEKISFMEVTKEIGQDPKRYLVVRKDKLREYIKMYCQETPETIKEISEKDIPQTEGKV